MDESKLPEGEPAGDAGKALPAAGSHDVEQIVTPPAQDVPPEYPVPPATRRANFWLFVSLVVFAVTLAVVVFLWMQGVVRSNGGVADPQHKPTSLCVPGRCKPAVWADFVLPTATPCFT